MPIRYTFIFLSILCSQFSFSQLKKGFDIDEATDLIALCNTFSFEELYNSDSKIIPVGYDKFFTSKTIGLDNKFQVFKKENYAVISFRGSTSKANSWVENMYSAMIPAQGVIQVEGENQPYNFSTKDSAAVHSGYALAVVLLSNQIIHQIELLNNKGVYNILLTGHSQGGALTNMTRAYLENLTNDILSHKNNYKSYSFANPMCGNKEFSEEFHERYESNQTAFRIINPDDFVPKMPFHYQEEGALLSKEHFKNWIFGKEKFDVRKLGTDILFRGMEKGFSAYIKSSNKLIEKIISTSQVKIVMPEYISDINYFQTGILYPLSRFTYPKIELDISKMTDLELEELKPDEDGKYYQKENKFFQHNTYNYYVGFLKDYDSKAYRQLKMKYLIENL